jgi:hypothetical protein
LSAEYRSTRPSPRSGCAEAWNLRHESDSRLTILTEPDRGTRPESADRRCDGNGSKKPSRRVSQSSAQEGIGCSYDTIALEIDQHGASARTAQALPALR